MSRFLLLFVFFGFLGCSESYRNYMVQVEVELSNISEEPVELDFFRDYINNDRQIVEFHLQEGTGFSTTFEVPGPVMSTFSVGRTRLPVYLEPGISLTLSGDANNLPNTVVFGGDGGDENNFLLRYNREMESRFGSALLQEQAASLSPDAYKEFAAGITQRKLDFLNAEGEGLSEIFLNFLKTTIQYEKYQLLLNYPALHQRLNQLEAPITLPDGYHDFLEDAIAWRGQSFTNLTYVGFLLSYMDHKKEAYDGDLDHLSRHEVNYMLAGRYLTDKPKYYIQALSISREMNSGDIDLALTLYDEYMEKSPVDSFKESLQYSLEVVRSLWAGNPAPGFVMTDINGETVSLSDYHGKVVYLKFWASWCGPCMREVPPAAELKERLADEKDLIFMYVSIDTDDKAWRNSVDRHGITGVHMRTPGRERGVPALYNVRWIPTFYIIGRDGNIFDHRPPKPSDKDIDKVLLKAMEM